MTSDPHWHDDELSAEEVRQLRRRRSVKRLLMTGVPTILLLAIGVAIGVPRIKEWRARQFAERADLLLGQGELQDAFNNASSALQLHPHLPEARRAYAAVMLAAGQAEGLETLQEMVEEGVATDDDRLRLAEGALTFGETAVAEHETLQLIQEGRKKPEALYVLAQVRLTQQRVSDALQALNESLEAGGGDQPKLLLAKLQIATNTAESVESAIELLTPLAARPDRVGLESLLTLVNSPALPTPGGPGWVRRLRDHPKATEEHRLMAASAEIRLDPASYTRVMRETVERYRNGSAEERMQLARWLNLNREFSTVLEVIGAEEAAKRSDLFLIRVDAIAGLGEWEAIATLLRGSNLPLQPPIVLLYRGRAARELGEPEISASFYRRAIIESARQPELMWYVINYLQRVGEDQVLEQELMRLTENPATAREAFEALVPIVQKRQDAAELHRLYQQMIRRLPADPAVQNDERYFAALVGQRPDVRGAREQLDQEPRMLAYRITFALTLLKNAQPAEALRVFDGITLDPGQIQPYQRAVLAAVLGANGREEEARQLAAAIPPASLTIQELELIAPWSTAD